MNKCKYTLVLFFVAIAMNLWQIRSNHILNSEILAVKQELNNSKLEIARLELIKNRYIKNLSLQTFEINPDLSLTNVEGENISLSDLLNSGQKIAIYFSQTGCLSCKENSLKMAASVLGSKGIEDYLIIGNFELLASFKKKVVELGYCQARCYNSELLINAKSETIESLVFLVNGDGIVRCPLELTELSEMELNDYLNDIQELL
ncbi:MAG: hypothetical protein LT105_15445 [Lentimicrobium sp.]|nr:hypothetical protein [Lentimicrobium sp.]